MEENDREKDRVKGGRGGRGELDLLNGSVSFLGDFGRDVLAKEDNVRLEDTAIGTSGTTGKNKGGVGLDGRLACNLNITIRAGEKE